MATRICVKCGKEHDVHGGKICEKGHFTCRYCASGHHHCAVCGKKMT